MKLEQLLEGVSYTLVQGSLELDIEDIIYDSRKAAPGRLFVCIVGTQRDSHDYAAQCVADGVTALSFFFILRAGEGIVVAVGGGLAVHAQLRRHLHALVLFGERHARPARVGGFVDRAVNGLFAGEERE